jgi:hypothetical protein
MGAPNDSAAPGDSPHFPYDAAGAMRPSIGLDAWA